MLLVLVASTCITPERFEGGALGGDAVFSVQLLSLWAQRRWSKSESLFLPLLLSIHFAGTTSSLFSSTWTETETRQRLWVSEALLPIVHLNWSCAFQKAQIPRCIVEMGSFLANKTRHFQGYPCCPPCMSPGSAQLYNPWEPASLVCGLWANPQVPSQKYPHFLMEWIVPKVYIIRLQTLHRLQELQSIYFKIIWPLGSSTGSKSHERRGFRRLWRGLYIWAWHLEIQVPSAGTWHITKTWQVGYSWKELSKCSSGMLNSGC